MKNRVGDWMTKHPIKIDKYESLKTAKELMEQESTKVLLVYDSGRLAGLLSLRDIQVAQKIQSQVKALDAAPFLVTVGDVMTTSTEKLHAEQTMDQAMRLINTKVSIGLPVLSSQGEVVGVLSDANICKYALVASQNPAMAL